MKDLNRSKISLQELVGAAELLMAGLESKEPFPDRLVLVEELRDRLSTEPFLPKPLYQAAQKRDLLRCSKLPIIQRTNKYVS